MSGPIRVNPDLEKERNAATFSTELMIHVLDCGQNVTHRRRAIENLAFSDADLTGPDVRQMSRDEKFTELIRRHVLVLNKLKQHNITDDSDRMTFTSAILGVESSGLSLHFVAFVPMLRLQASDEQLKRWMPLVESFRMIGCYAQTELGHGTFVRGLETTAVYDPAKKEFLLNTPTITSTKWWVGGLGKTANHAVIMAQLYTKGKCHGIHAFLLPLRDNNHMPLRGVTVGDIGPKLGMNGVDNGYLQLQNVRIPLDNMLMKHAKVLEDGTYVKPANEKIIYGGMLGIRAQLPTLAAKLLSLGVTIAIRYSCVRRQSELKPGAGEPQVLDYQTQQDKLFPLLAQAYAYNCVAQKVKQMLDEVMLQVKDGNYQGLIEAHALASGLKSLTTVRTSWGIEMCRLSCGGHGYSEASNLPSIFVAAAGPATAEGEATILLLQTARYIMKNYLAAQNNKRIDKFMSYLKPGANVSNRFLSGTFDLQTLLSAYEFRALKLVNRAANCIHNQIISRQLSPEEAWNESSIELVKAAMAHTEYFIMAMFVDKVENVACHPSVRAALVKLCTLHAVHGIIQNAGDFLQEGYVNGSDLETLRDKLFALYQSVRVDAVAYVDAFDFNDRHLNSALGRYDGQVYESLYQWASESKLNSTAVHPSFHKYLHPQRIIQSSKL